MMSDWVKQVQKGLKEYNDLVYNAHGMLKDYYAYEQLLWMPLRNIMDKLAEFKPRFQEIARRQQQAQLQQQLEGKRQARANNPNEAWRKNYKM